ncbi:hypothetical protein Pfo_008173 [Paulownia fortunei]|nr:hypothetical protein Pfo_008173 [Paulownia fortunei]
MSLDLCSQSACLWTALFLNLRSQTMPDEILNLSGGRAAASSSKLLAHVKDDIEQSIGVFALIFSPASRENYPVRKSSPTYKLVERSLAMPQQHTLTLKILPTDGQFHVIGYRSRRFCFELLLGMTSSHLRPIPSPRAIYICFPEIDLVAHLSLAVQIMTPRMVLVDENFERDKGREQAKHVIRNGKKDTTAVPLCWSAGSPRIKEWQDGRCCSESEAENNLVCVTGKVENFNFCVISLRNIPFNLEESFHFELENSIS